MQISDVIFKRIFADADFQKKLSTIGLLSISASAEIVEELSSFHSVACYTNVIQTELTALRPND